MADDPVQKALEGAKSTLSKAYNFTQSVEGQPVSQHFAPKKIEPPKVPQARQPSYSLAAQARSAAAQTPSTAAGLKARRENVQQYLKANPQ